MKTWAMYINLAFQTSPSGKSSDYDKKKKKGYKFAESPVTCMEELV